jgi:hypothetical protein
MPVRRDIPMQMPIQNSTGIFQATGGPLDAKGCQHRPDRERVPASATSNNLSMLP